MADAVLRPTLWRTCRVLANRDRLKMLALLLPDLELTVSVVASRLCMPVARASLYLRALEARSLLAVQRKGRSVLYRIATGGPVASILRALKTVSLRDKKSRAVIFALATAFTHPRRIEIYKALEHGTKKLSELSADTGIPPKTAWRHLDKLQRRGFVIHERRRDVYLVVVHQHPFGRALAELVVR